MKRWKKVSIGFGALLALLLLVAVVVVERWAHNKPHPELTVPPELRDRVNARVSALGVKVPDGGIVLEHPFDAPFSSRSLVVPLAWMGPPGKYLIAPPHPRASEVLKDVELLEQILPRQYGGYEWIARRGFDWAQWFKDWRADLSSKGDAELSLEEAFAPMVKLSQRQLDNHTQIPLTLGGLRSPSRSWLLAHEGASCTKVRIRGGAERALAPGDLGEQPHRALVPSGDALKPAWYLSLPERDGELESISCGAEWISLEPLAPHSPSDASAIIADMTARPEVKRLDESTVWFKIPSMNPSVYADLEQRRAGWPKPDGKERTLIVDLRGNGGGSDEYGFEVLKGFVAAPPDGMKKFHRTLVKSCLYPALRWNFGQMFNPGVHAPLEPDELKEWQEDVDALFAESPEGCPRVNEETPGEVKLAERTPKPVKDGPLIIVWMDSGCGSDCEALATELAPLPNVWFVGTSSAGVAQFIQPGYGVLPHTGLPFRFALGMSDVYGDDRAFDGHGLNVDVVLPASGDWTPEKVAKLAPLMR
ncbi:MAG: S41 family peptidase [Myxococcaceae bacterium]